MQTCFDGLRPEGVSKSDGRTGVNEDSQRTRGVDALTVIVPAYNEEAGIVSVLQQLQEALGPLGVQYEILVVDDGSTDATADKVRSFSGEIKVVQTGRNQGYGAAIKAGIRRALYPWIMITDADGTYPVEEIPKLLDAASDWDMVVGARTAPDAKLSGLRQFAKWFLVKLAEYLSETEIRDMNSGMRLFRKDLAAKFLSILPSGFSLTTTISLAFLSEGYTIGYVPISYNKRVGRSKIRPIADTINFLTLILRTTVYFKPLKVILPLSGALVLAAVAIFLYGWLVVGHQFDITVTILILFAMQITVLGLLADLFVKRRG
ncbi:MAG: glycosyltransferase family 2 protein [Candidatus Omnitrophica bacterium]|nr:glycosyltransferase family 2 protein [Candidatus Omnitrophota bacterium]